MSDSDSGPERIPKSDAMLGTIVDERYAIEELIGTGGMGRVYRAHQRSTGRDVAIKVLAERFNLKQEIVSRFSQEAKIISRLRHPNTIRLFDVGQLPDGRLYLVTELLSGVSLSSILKEGPLDIERTMQIASQVCDALHEAHSQGIIHRDLKPANLMLETVGDREYVKVLDFGIAKLAGGDSDTTLSGMILGTPTYMSPEQALGTPVDLRSDIYSLGIILYYCVAGRPPFAPDTPHAVVYHHVHVTPPRFSELPEPVSVPAKLQDLISDMLAKDRDHRPSDTREVQRRLHAVMTQPEIESTKTGEVAADITAAQFDGTEARMEPIEAQPNPNSSRMLQGFVGILLLFVVIAFGTVARQWIWPTPVALPLAQPTSDSTPRAAQGPADSVDTPDRTPSAIVPATTSSNAAELPPLVEEPPQVQPPPPPATPPPKVNKAQKRRVIRPKVKRKARVSAPSDPADETPQGFVDVFDDD